jgi:O-antigen/teichoic acid export membrane protein
MLRNYSYAAGGQVAQTVIAVLGLVATTRLLGPADYGAFVVLGTVLTLLGVFVSAGPAAAVLVLSSRSSGNAGRAIHGQIVIATLALALASGVGGVLAAEPLARFVSSSVAAGVVLLSLLRLPALVYASLVNGQLAGAGRIGHVAALNTASAALALLAPAGAIVHSDPLEGALIGSAAGAFLAALLMYATASRIIGVSLPRGWQPWKEAGQLALPMHVGTMAYWVMLRSDTIAVNALLGSASAGIYGLSLQLSERIGLVTAPLYNATAWQVSGPDREVAVRVMLRVARIEFAIGLLAAAGALLVGPLVIELIAGRAFAGAALPLAILVLGAATLPVWSSIGLFLVSHHRGAWPTAAVQVIVAALAVAGYWTVGGRVGVVGPAIVSTGAYIALVVTGIVMVRAKEPIALRDLAPTRADAADARRAAGRLLRAARRAVGGSGSVTG